ncbi:PAS domain-containing protein [Novosphingobium sp. JCM 18896]|uniref:GAF domain-containing hybrid sensor histidine kinase/response regulator n=1 Tax=Novosphingobium sp. JCM 18896 TaxID=2989731 RepID=UPI002221F55B|nr:PAS domain-containing protein [Novosphingobium sp. JCM 18896]MCW1431798.1 PAS domain-containing protein [Novosphingobium sp. JCM 18896]
MLDGEDRWRTALDAAGMGVWDWDVVGGRIYYSQIWKEMRGLGDDDDGPAIGQWREWVHPDDHALVDSTLADHLAGLTPHYELEHRIKCTDGSYKWVIARGMACEHDADGQPTRIIGTNLDIDAAKRAAILARRHGKLLEAIAACNLAIARRKSIDELSSDICRILVERGEIDMAWVGRPSPDGRLIEPVTSYSLDPEAHDIKQFVIMTSADHPFGRGPTGTAYRGPSAVWIDDVVTDVSTEVWHDRATSSGLKGAAAIPIYQKGRIVNVLTLYTDEPAFFDETTKALLQDMGAQFGLALDALEAERAATRFRNSLRLSEWRARAIFERAPLGIALVDSVTGLILDANAKFQEIVDRDLVTLQRLSWQDITPPDQLQKCIEDVTPFFNGEVQSFSSEKGYLRPDGSVVPTSLTATRFDTPDGENPRHLVMIEDITERIDLQQQLSQRQRLEALGQLTGGIAHDFNNLLTVIIGNSEALACELGEGDLGELAGLILTTGERAAELTGRLLTFARKQSLMPSAIKIGDLLDGLLPLLRRAIPDGIDLKLPARFSTRSVYADPAQLEMALLNLVLNARDAMPRGGVIEISSENILVGKKPGVIELQPGPYVVLALSDDGLGMTEETLEKAFDPFFTTKGPGQGSGLGLSMVYGFARQSGGHVEIASRPGEGTTVRLYLPATTEARPHAPSAQATPHDRGTGEVVLIAEDDAMVRKFVSSQVDALGYQTIAVLDGHSALAVLGSDTHVDLLFTDIAMDGGMDGIELVHRARAIRPELPVLFTSGHAEEHLQRLAEIDALLLRKPYRKKELAAHLRQALGGSETA